MGRRSDRRAADHVHSPMPGISRSTVYPAASKLPRSIAPDLAHAIDLEIHREDPGDLRRRVAQDLIGRAKLSVLPLERL